jgi:predicted transposase YbfD/YdcC
VLALKGNQGDAFEAVKLKSIICIESEPCIQGKTSREKRYYLSSFPAKAKTLLRIIRDHWAIENSLHWVMDTTFAEDGCRARTKNAPENMAILRRLVANVLQKIKKPNDTLKGLRIRASINESRLLGYIYAF